jgi:chloride channel 3/4/5
MTVSLVVIMFELTGTLVYMLPIMAAVLVSKWVSDATGVRSIYDLINELNGHPYLDSHREYIHECLAIDITEPMETIDAHEHNDVGLLTAKLRRLESSGYKDAGFSIVQGEILQGYIAANELEHALECVHAAGNDDIECTFLRERGVWDEETEEECLGEVQMGDFSQYVDRAPLTINQNASMELAMELFIKLGVRYLCVTDSAGRYLGVIHKKRLLAYLREFDE